MSAQFFYGTLCDPGLRAIVLGRDDARVVAARLGGHAVHHAGDAAWPMIMAAPGQTAPGVLACDLSDRDRARLAFFEGGFGYDLRAVTVETAAGPQDAMVWFPAPGMARPGHPWLLAEWQSRHAALAHLAATEAMTLFDQITPADLARMWPMIERRAQAWLVAEQARDAGLSGRSRGDVTMLARRKPYHKFYALDEYDLRVRDFDGTAGPRIERAVFRSADAALVLPYDPGRDAVLLVEQFRMGPYGRGDAFPWCLEPIAGHVDTGETPEATARREALEEANLRIDRLIPIGAGYASPGDATTHFHLFCAPCDLPDSAAGIGGLAQESENIRAHILPFARFLDLLDGGRLNVMPLMVMGHWLARHRDRLRAA